MTQHHQIWMPIGILTMLTVAVSPAAAQPPTSEWRIQELVRLAAQQIASDQQASGIDSPQGSTASSPPVDNRATVSLTLDDVVKLALDRNLNIIVQRLNPPQFDPAMLRSTHSRCSAAGPSIRAGSRSWSPRSLAISQISS
jgi:hypothetical protein